MSMKDLLSHIDKELPAYGSLVIDQTEFHRITGLTDYHWTRNSVNRIAFLIPALRRSYLASAESMLNIETMKVARVYLVVANSQETYAERVVTLREQVQRELGGDVIGRHENRYPKT